MSNTLPTNLFVQAKQLQRPPKLTKRKYCSHLFSIHNPFSSFTFNISQLWGISVSEMFKFRKHMSITSPSGLHNTCTWFDTKHFFPIWTSFISTYRDNIQNWSLKSQTANPQPLKAWPHPHDMLSTTNSNTY